MGFLSSLFGVNTEDKALKEALDHKQSDNTNNTIFINSETSGSQWLLCRDGQSVPVLGDVLIVLFLGAQQDGWMPKNLFSTNGKTVSFSLRPCEISDGDAKDLARIIKSTLKAPTTNEETDALRDIQAFISFFAEGRFQIRSA